MKPFRIDLIGKLLGSFDIRDFQESVIMHAVIDVFLLQLTGKNIVTIHIELQSERYPGVDAQIAQTKFFINVY